MRRHARPILLSILLAVTGGLPAEGAAAQRPMAAPFENRTGTLQANEVLRLEWGSGERQAGIREIPGGKLGPQALTVQATRQWIHILDSANDRILTIGPDGELVSSVPVPSLAEDVTILPSGAFVVFVPATSSLECGTSGGGPCGRVHLPRVVTQKRQRTIRRR